MSERRPANPPAIPGYRYLRLLGSGGFSDVFGYEQEMPRREVAVKVLLGEADPRVRERFVDEANLMASLASHPSIVTILHAAVSSDGRPYIVMEYYPGPNLRVQSRTPLAVPKVLSYGVQIACAVETAHRAGVLHRDIKPANILVNQYGLPALTDFGIAATATDLAAERDEDSGLSVPWSPPEVLHNGRAADARSDVFSLAATLFTLLTGRTPFERLDGRNGPQELMRRIETEDPQPLDRADVPESLERLLRQSMSRQPGARPRTAHAFAQALQGVEHEMRLPVTPLVIMEQPRPADVVDDTTAHPDIDARTRLKSAGGPVLDPQRRPVTWAPGPQNGADRPADVTRHKTAGVVPGAHGPVPGQEWGRPSEAQSPVVVPRPDDAFAHAASAASSSGERAWRPVDALSERPADTLARQPVLVPERSDGASGPSARLRIAFVVLLVLLVGGLAVAVLPGLRGTSDKAGQAAPTADPGDGDALTGQGRPVAVTGLAMSRSASTVVVRWKNDQGRSGDTYFWRRTDPGASPQRAVAKETTVKITGIPKATRACVEVVVVRDGALSDPATVCEAA